MLATNLATFSFLDLVKMKCKLFVVSQTTQLIYVIYFAKITKTHEKNANEITLAF